MAFYNGGIRSNLPTFNREYIGSNLAWDKNIFRVMQTNAITADSTEDPTKPATSMSQIVKSNLDTFKTIKIKWHEHTPIDYDGSPTHLYRENAKTFDNPAFNSKINFINTSEVFPLETTIKQTDLIEYDGNKAIQVKTTNRVATPFYYENGTLKKGAYSILSIGTSGTLMFLMALTNLTGENTITFVSMLFTGTMNSKTVNLFPIIDTIEPTY